ncbi:OmpH family outer membrane protein [Chryseobacterium scophthalmum]|uniref:OmpH family outer membrane protein n=1 Tax=Chryseobacterium scophthalmum TaxID=59733 RepID=UPI001AEC4628|nr:OmpH family outer membrane protein [Chryseobacterium scophthalmum]
MKNFKTLFTLAVILLFGFSNAQKIGVIDTQYILDKMPQYKEAEARLNAQIDTWEQEIKNIQSQYEQKKSAFESEKVLLIGDQLKLREKEVLDLEKSIQTTLSLRFGKTGEINQLRANLVEPFQDQIYTALRAVIAKNGLGIVFDKNRDNVLSYEPRYDYTDKVLAVLLKGTEKEKEKKTNKK